MRYRAPSRLRGLVMLSLLAMAMTGCGGDGARSGSASATSSPARSGPSAASAPPPELLGQRVDPARFQTTIDNPYLPLAPGTRLRYEGTSDEGPETVTVEVTRETKRILGVPTVVVRDRVT